MRTSLLQRSLVLVMVLWLGTCIAGCGPKVEGKYVAPENVMTIELKSGKATITTLVSSPETADYTVDGNKITVKSKAGDIPLTINKDGNLEGPQGMTLKRADK